MKLTVLTFSILLLTAPPTIGSASARDRKQVARYRVDTSRPRQVVEHFGASDAWSMQYIGLWPEEQRNQVADWLFSTENNAQGQPRGIGLSLWRFNLGAGSWEQGRASQINPMTRTECFLQADGTYDWDKQLGQRRFLRLAKERGVPRFLAFMNSMPVFFTKNGLATNTGRDGTINLRDDRYEAAAKFCSTVLKGLERQDGIHLDYISPVNEPDGHWNWLGPKQEGSPATNREIARLVKILDHQLTQDSLSTRILVNESSDLRCILGEYKAGWQRGNTLATFFSGDSVADLGGLRHVPRLLLGHSYWTNTPVPYMKRIRQQLREACERYQVGFWQSEICIMSNDEEIGGGNHFDFSMKTALYVARVIHHDLVYADAGSWSWWRAAGGDYKDGLIRIITTDNMKSGEVRDSKLMWSLGNFSRFIRPGARRYEVEAHSKGGQIMQDKATEPRGIMASAYRNVDGSWVVVAINYGTDSREFVFDVDASVREWQAYRTSDMPGENLKPVGTTDGTTRLPAKSITTFLTK